MSFSKQGNVDKASDGPKSGGGAAAALAALEPLAKSARARSALNTLRSELLGGDDAPDKSSKPDFGGARKSAAERFRSMSSAKG